MTPTVLLADLAVRGVVINLAGDDITLRGSAAVLTDADVAALREAKPAILELLRSRCRPHNDPAHYIDTPDPTRAGWIRSTCMLCGCFIGYRSTSK